MQKVVNIHELANVEEISIVFLLVSPYFSYLLFGILFLLFAFKLSYNQNKEIE